MTHLSSYYKGRDKEKKKEEEELNAEELNAEQQQRYMNSPLQKFFVLFCEDTNTLLVYVSYRYNVYHLYFIMQL